MAEVLESRRLFAAFAVTTTADAGVGSLRQAILDADATGGGNTINFAIAGSGSHTISLQAALPAITTPLVLNGASQPGYAGTPLIELDGSAAGSGNGLTIGAAATVEGLAITHFGASGVEAFNTASVSLIGDELNDNGSAGALIDTTSNVDVERTIANNNGSDGVSLFDDSSVALNGNTINGNARFGLYITGSATDDAITANTIDANLSDGVRVAISPSGSASDAMPLTFGNDTVAGNGGNGFTLDGSTGVVIVGGSIIANARNGLSLIDQSVGDSITSSTIAGNGLDGIDIAVGSSAIASQNSIDSNVSLGIASNANGIPTLMNAASGDFGTTINGTLQASPDTTYTVELYANPDDGRQGHTYLATVYATTDGSGGATFTDTASGDLPSGESLTATATSAAGTSAFSAPITPGAFAKLENGTLIGSNAGGNDTITITSGNGEIQVDDNGNTQSFPQSGVSRIAYTLGAGDCQLTLGSGVGPASISGTTGNDTIVAGDGNDTISAGSGNVSIRGGSGIDSLAGGTGDDTIVAGSGTTQSTAGSGDSLLVAGSGLDTATGGSGDDTLAAGTGHCQLVGGSGCAILVTNNYTGDTLIGGSGLTFAKASTGNVEANISGYFDVSRHGPTGSVYGNLDIPTISGSGGSGESDAVPGAIHPLDAAPDGASYIESSGTLYVFGTAGNDNLRVKADSSGNLIIMDNGQVDATLPAAGLTGLMVSGGPGNDTIHVDDSVTLSDTLRGGPGDDSLTGGGGDSVLVGGVGNDTLVGGDAVNLLIPLPRRFVGTSTGNDVLIGGPAGSCNIADFTHRTDPLYLTNNGLPDSGDPALGDSITIMPSVRDIFSGTGNDTVIGAIAGSMLTAGQGLDSLQAVGANNVLTAGSNGGDTLSASDPGVNVLFLMNGHADEYIAGASDMLQLDNGMDWSGN